MALSDLFRDAGGDDIQDVEGRFDQVALQASPEELGAGVAEALRSDQTPPMAEMVSQLFGRSSSSQQAGLLNQILGDQDFGQRRLADCLVPDAAQRPLTAAV